MIDELTAVFSTAALPAAMLWAASKQPNDNRSMLCLILSGLHAIYLLAAVATPLPWYWLSYVAASVISVACIHQLMLSDGDGEWCWRISQLMFISVLFNGFGGWLWTAYYPPTAYNVAMFVVNLMVIRAIMVDCDPAGRTDVSSMVGGRDALSFLPRLGLGAAREAAK